MLRAALAARWVLAGRGIPPVPFVELLEIAPAVIKALVPDPLAHKARTIKGERMARIPELEAFLATTLADGESKRARSTSPNDFRARLDHLLLAEIRNCVPEVAADYTLERVRRPDVLLFEAVAGSKAYGTDLEHSDEDLRGVFIATNGFRMGLDHLEQVSDARGDVVYYELGRWVELLLRNNPNAMELLAMPDDCIHFRHPLFDELKLTMFLSKLCEKTCGEYAMGQIRKACGLNKKNRQPPAGATTSAALVLSCAHGRGYDSKNLMHTIRLLEMAYEIACEGILRVRRPNREFLLRIRAGEFACEELLAKAEHLYAGLPPPAFAASGLPDEPDRARVNELLIRIPRAFPGSDATAIAPGTNPTIAGTI